VVAVALAAGTTAALAATAQPGTPTARTVRDTTLSVRTLTGALPDGATYKIEVPAHWNRTLFLYSHGYMASGSPNPAQDSGDPITGGWLLSHGYALAGSSYARTGWAVEQALPDQVATLGMFDRRVGPPRQTIAWGHSLGGLITAGLIQAYPGRFTAALPMCGALAGGVAIWNTYLDAGFVIKTLLAPSVQVAHIANATANLAAAERAATVAQRSAQGRARLSLAAALADIPGWFTPLSPEPGRTDYAGQEDNQYLALSQLELPLTFDLRAELESRAGGNPSWNAGVDYTADLARSADATEVGALYRTAHLSLAADLATLARAGRIAADHRALQYLTRNVTFTGQLSVPVLTMQTTGDPNVVSESDQAYLTAVTKAGDAALLRETFIQRAGHCAFTPAETIAAVQVLLNRLHSGHWDAAALTPGALNARAAALGPAYNAIPDGAKLVPVPPAYVRYRPGSYPRPYSQPISRRDFS
jgi:dienelactone hydrolase